jgi:TonB family protein
MRLTFFAGLLLYALAAQAQQTAPAAPKVENLGEHYIDPGQALYPHELAQQGVQGRTVIEGLLHPDLRMSDLKVITSSRSEVLDKNALLIIRAIDPGIKKAPLEVTKFTVTIVFMRDSIEQLKEKTCSEFIADFDYFRKTFPELPMTDMPLIGYVSGILIMVKPDTYRLYMGREESIIKRTVAICRASPERRFVATMVAEIK